MKKAKLLTCLVGLTAVTALTGCFETSYKEGVAICFTDANGKVYNYTTKELFEDYSTTSSTASSNFDKIKEILVRKYYEASSRSGDLAVLKESAQLKVDGIKSQAETNAKSNGTTYATELESLLDGENVDNVEELYQKKLYAVELEKFEKDYQDSNITAMRDGKYEDGKDFFPEDKNFGKGSNGYIKTRMPYNVSHILLEASGASETDGTSTPLSETEAATFGDVILMMAGASTEDSDYGKKASSNRISFGQLAKTYSKDTGSAENYGNLGIMDTTSSYVQGFQYGVYSYDLFYNKSSKKSDGKDSAIMYSSDATYRDENGTEAKLSEATSDGGVLGDIGTIPFGAAVALANDSVNKNFPNQSYNVNDNDTAYMPRNVIWNKYFNSHRIAVITPNRIAYDDVVEAGFTEASETAAATKYADSDGYYNKEAEDKAFKGTKDENYAKLPGFSHDTTSIVDVKDANGNSENVLTNEKGQIILAVRGDSGTKGIHFIVIERSPLVEYAGFDSNGIYTETDSSSTTADITSLSEYYTIENPSESTKYPTYESGSSKVNKTTLVTMGLDTTKENYTKNVDSLKSKIKSAYSSDLDTYEVQYLVKETNAEFNTSNVTVNNIVQSVYTYSTQKRKKNAEDAAKSIDEAWAKYAEFLVQEDAARDTKEDGSQKLISEAAALTYNTADARDQKGIWGIVSSGTHAGQPGACYKK